MVIFEKKDLKDQVIIHTIREDIIINEFQRLFKNLLPQINLFSQNGSIAKMAK
jgi:hypothetical protein